MNKTKLIAVAAGFLAAAGIATAGKIFIDGVDKGTYQDVQINGNGTVKITTSNSGTTGPSCDAATAFSTSTGCVCASGYEYAGVEGGPVPEDTACTAVEDPVEPPPTSANCSGGAGTRDNGWSRFSHFPKATGDKDRFTIDNGKYLAIEFTAPGADRAGYIGTAADSHAMNDQHAMAISRCPGEFNENLGTGVCRKASASHTFWWSTFGEHASTTCELTPGETYYLNIKYAKLSNLSSITCGASVECGALLFWSNYN